jgi:uncharacterized protein (DUF433 family)
VSVICEPDGASAFVCACWATSILLRQSFELLRVNLRVEDTDVQFGRISINSNICHGQACVKGTRMPVHQIVRMLANGDTVEDLLGEYPFLSREDIMASLDYAAGLAEEQVTPIEVANL